MVYMGNCHTILMIIIFALLSLCSSHDIIEPTVGHCGTIDCDLRALESDIIKVC